MPPPTAPQPQPARNPKDAVPLHKQPVAVEGPPDEEFWERYNKRLEFPLATMGTIFGHVVIGALLVFFLAILMASDDRSGPPIKLVAVDGMDESGEGSAGSGGTPDPLAIADTDPFRVAKDVLPTPEALKDARENIKNIVLDDPNSKLAISAYNAAAYSQLDQSVRNKLLGAGSQQGSGNQPGRGHDGTPGAGPGGTGADSTRARSLRWVLRFRVTSGRDYLDQLKSMGAEILVPIPPADKDCLLIPDLNNIAQHRTTTDADFKRLANKIKFSDTRRDAVQGVAGALGLDFRPKTFWAFFPKDLEDRLARLETSYRNRRAEDIEETVFRVTIRGGTYDIVVDEQTIKR